MIQLISFFDIVCGAAPSSSAFKLRIALMKVDFPTPDRPKTAKVTDVVFH
jgi:hypothetical protein